jgi:serine/threonine-protein kinase
MGSEAWYCPLCQAEGKDARSFCPADGARVRPLSERGKEWLGRVLAERYRVLRFIDAGGTAEVYEAERVDTGRHVAVKFLHAALAGSRDAVDRFRHEAELVSRIAHPNVVAISDFGTLSDGVYFMVMELLRGEPLAAVLERGLVPIEEAFRIALQTSEGLAAAHERSVIHCDVKPSNLFLEGPGVGGTVKILDLGIGRFVAAAVKPGAPAATVVGTPAYMSPEQAQGHGVGPASDIYSLGVVLYEMLFGAEPFVGNSVVDVMRQHIQTPVPWPEEKARQRGIPTETRAVLLRALAKSPAERHGTMLEFQHDLAGCARQRRAAALTSSTPPGPRPAPGSARRIPITESRESARPTPSIRTARTDTQLTSPGGLFDALKRVPLIECTGNDEEVVELAPDVFWVGRRHGRLLECNAFLRVFRSEGAEVSVLIDPGPPKDLSVVLAKTASVIGSIGRLDYVFLNHQDPDVASNAAAIQQASRRAQILCSEDTWRLAQFYGLDGARFTPTEALRDKRLQLPTGHELEFVPTPFCHFRGATMLFDRQTGVLFSGDLFGGARAHSLRAREEDWPGIAMFHQIYMPTSRALARAVRAVRELSPAVTTIAPQHGALLTGDYVARALEFVKGLKVGIDLIEDEEVNPQYLEAANDLIREFAEVAGVEAARALLTAGAGDETFTRLLSVGDGIHVLSLKAAPEAVLDALAAAALAALPAELRGDFQRSVRAIWAQSGLIRPGEKPKPPSASRVPLIKRAD